MKMITRIAAVLVLTASFATVSGQSSQTKMQRYADAFSLDTEQVVQLEEIYADFEAEEKALSAKMVAHRESMRAVASIPSENAQWKEQQNELSLERKDLTERKNEAMLEVFDGKQKAAWNDWQAGKITWKEIPSQLEK